MKKSRFTKEQTVAAVQQAEPWIPLLKSTGEWANELSKMHQLKDENRKLKSLLADPTLDKHMFMRLSQK